MVNGRRDSQTALSHHFYNFLSCFWFPCQSLFRLLKLIFFLLRPTQSLVNQFLFSKIWAQYIYTSSLRNWLKVRPTSTRRSRDRNWLIFIVVTIFDSNKISRVKRTTFSVTIWVKIWTFLIAWNIILMLSDEVAKLKENNREASLHTKEAIFNELWQ